MPPSRNNTVKFTDLQAISSVNIGDIIPVVDTSVPTLVNKKINVQDFSRSLPVASQVAQMGTVSANWNSNYSTTQSNSAFWGTGGSYGSAYSANSAEYESTYSSVNTTSAKWNSAYTTLNSTSGVYTTVQSVSDTWSTGTALASSAYTSFNTLSTGTWLLKAGDQLTGALTTTKTLTTQFTNMDELVSKRYVDAISTISGNFVPSLYYTKNNIDTGFVSRTNAIITPTWNNVSTVFTALSVDVTNIAADNTSLLANFILNGNSMARFGGTGTGAASLTLGDGRGIVTTNGNSIMLRSGTGGGYPYFFSPTGYMLVGGSGSTSGIAFSIQDPASNLPDIYLTLDNATNLGIRNGSIPQALRVYNNYVNSTTNFERFGLSGNRLAYELSGSQKFYIGSTAANGIIAWANNIGGFNTLDVYNQADWQFARNGSTTHVLRAGGSFETRAFGNGLTIDDGTGVRGGILFDSADTVGIRNSTNSQNLRIYNTYTNATNYERLSLSATRIAYEFAGTGVSRDLTILTTGNLILSAGASIQLSQALPFQIAPLSSSDLTAPNGLTVVTGGGTRGVFAIDQYSHGFYSESGGSSFGSGGGQKCAIIYGGMSYYKNNPNRTLFGVNDDGKIFMGRLLGNYFTTNYTTSPRVSAHVSIITDSSYNSHVSDMLLLSAGPGTPSPSSQYFTRFYTQADGTSILSVRKDGFTVLGVGGLGRVYLYENVNLGIDLDPTNPTGSSSLASYMHFGWSSTIAANGTKDIALFRAGAGRLEQRASTTAQNYSIYNTYTDGNNYERLSLSATRIAYEYAGTGVARDLTISTAGNLILSGASISFNTATPYSFGTSQLSANKISINYVGGFQTTNFLACESPDGYVIGTNNSGGSYHFVSVNNYAANNGNAALASARGQWNFPSVINAPTAFTLNNQMYLLNYTATTDLIAVSSTRSTNGFYFYPTSTSYPAAASIYLDSQSFLNLNFQGGGGKSCVIGDGTNISLEARYPGNVSTMNGHWQFNAFNTATNNVTINQTAGQYGTLLRVLSTNSTAMFGVSSDGVSRFNNKVFIKPTGLIQFTNETATTPAIKGTSTTIQARTGDDSQYTYLQGKLQTDQAASAGTFTPDKYIILYDNTGTAYKVPVQAL